MRLRIFYDSFPMGDGPDVHFKTYRLAFREWRYEVRVRPNERRCLVAMMLLDARRELRKQVKT